MRLGSELHIVFHNTVHSFCEVIGNAPDATSIYMPKRVMNPPLAGKKLSDNDCQPTSALYLAESHLTSRRYCPCFPSYKPLAGRSGR